MITTVLSIIGGIVLALIALVVIGFAGWAILMAIYWKSD